MINKSLKNAEKTPERGNGVLENIQTSNKTAELTALISMLAALACYPSNANAAEPLEYTQFTNDLNDIKETGSKPSPNTYIGNGISEPYQLDNGMNLGITQNGLAIYNTNGSVLKIIDRNQIPVEFNFVGLYTSPNAIYSVFKNASGNSQVLRLERESVESLGQIEGEVLTNFDSLNPNAIAIVSVNGSKADILTNGNDNLSAIIKVPSTTNSKGYNLTTITLQPSHPIHQSITQAWQQAGYSNINTIPRIGYTQDGMAKWATPDGKTWQHEIGITGNEQPIEAVKLTYNETPTITQENNIFSVTTDKELPQGHSLKVEFAQNVMSKTLDKDQNINLQYNLIFTPEMGQTLGDTITATIKEYDQDGKEIVADPEYKVVFTIQMDIEPLDMGMPDMTDPLDMRPDMNEPDLPITPDMEPTPDMPKTPDLGTPDMNQEDMGTTPPNKPGDNDGVCSVVPSKPASPAGGLAGLLIAAAAILRRRK